MSFLLPTELASVNEILSRYWTNATPGDYAWLISGVLLVAWAFVRTARRPV